MLVLGIDPGTAICGYAVVEQLGNKIHAVQYGAVLTDKDEKPELRLKKIYEEISALIDHYKPDLMSIEKLFFKQNITTGIPVGQARGVILLAASNQGLPILEFAPSEIKKNVVGTGAATKEQVTYMVQHLLNIKEKPKPDDVADALAAALCGINTASTMRWVNKN
ncbi:MAG: crossover junction endodeoxyribonuclease RuvC [Phascolarctobacterium sp.]|nr:crossover junction endodeoxyribonuclease RuvC [Candidatus Phascolarctobacterium caballi]